MALTLTDLQTLQAQILATDLDNYAGETPIAADQTKQINWALRAISKRMLMLAHSVNLTLVGGTQAYNLMDDGRINMPATVSLRVWYPFSVTINNQPLQDRWNRSYGLWSLRELERQYPGYRNSEPGSPTVACWLGQNGHGNLILYPTPSDGVAAIEGNVHYVSGLALAPDLVNPTDVPLIPEDCHEAIAALAAVYAAIPTVTEDEGWKRVQALGNYHEPVDATRQLNAAIIRNFSGNTNPFPFFLEDERNDSK